MLIGKQHRDAMFFPFLLWTFFLLGTQVIQCRGPAGWERCCEAPSRQPEVVAQGLVTASPMEATVTAQQLSQKSQLAATVAVFIAVN